MKQHHKGRHQLGEAVELELSIECSVNWHNLSWTFQAAAVSECSWASAAGSEAYGCAVQSSIGSWLWSLWLCSAVEHRQLTLKLMAVQCSRISAANSEAYGCAVQSSIGSRLWSLWLCSAVEYRQPTLKLMAVQCSRVLAANSEAYGYAESHSSLIWMKRSCSSMSRGHGL